MVLDRPNPIGDAVAGPMRDPAMEAFVAHHPLPVRHGMTVRELAKADMAYAPPLNETWDPMVLDAEMVLMRLR